MSTAAQKASFEFRPPQLTGPQKVVAFSVTSSAARSNITNHLATADKPQNNPRPRTAFQLTVKATGGTVYVAFKLGSAAASVTSSTGWPIPDGDERSFWVNLNEVNDIEYITASTATLFMFISSPTY